MKNYTACTLITTCLVSMALRAEDPLPGNLKNFHPRPAVFRIHPEVVTPGLEPFTVTIGAFGNNLNRNSNDGFEPVVFRNQILVGEDSPDRILPANKNMITEWNSWSSGYLDGAKVRIYRFINGELKLVRTDRVVEGGTVINAWNFSSSRVIKADQHEGYWGWADWSRQDTTDWFTIIAVDKAGNPSPGTPISVRRPAGSHKANPNDHNQTDSFRENSKFKPSGPLPAPQNIQYTLRDDNLIHFTWDPVNSPDLAGYCIAQSDNRPEGMGEIHLQLSESPENSDQHVMAGDLVIVDHEFMEFDSRFLSNRLGNLERSIRAYFPGHVPNGLMPGNENGSGWRLVEHPADTPVPEAGRTYFEMTVAAGDEQKVGKYGIPAISTTEQDYYPVPRPVEYVMEVWMKVDRTDASEVTFEYDGDRRVGGFVEPFSFQPETEWRKFTHRFTGAPSDEGHHAYFVLTCKGPATYSIDNYRLYRADSPYLGFEPEEAEQFRESGMSAIRTHGPIKTGKNTYSMAAFTNSGGVIQGIPKGNTLPQQLEAIQAVSARPWFQIEYHMSPEEWLGFAEFMAAPYDPAIDTPATKPWAAKRVAQGREAPWVDSFDEIYFELSNETWNRLFSPWVFPFTGMPDHGSEQHFSRGEIYGKMYDHVVEILRSSPYWTDKIDQKFVHVLGGWAIQNYSQQAVEGSKTADYITIAAYNGGWDEGEGPPKVNRASFFNLLSHPNVNSVQRARQYLELKTEFAKKGRDISLGTYEAGPGYAMNGLNNARVSKEQARAQEEVMKSKAAGTATLDSFLTYAYHGFDLQNFFTFSSGTLWSSHAKWYRGGQAYPSFLALTLFNRLGTGDMLRSETLSVGTVDLPSLRRRSAQEKGPLATVYATRNEDRLTLFCVNRMVANYPMVGHNGQSPFGLYLPITQAERVTLYRLSGQITDHNIESEKVKIERVDVPVESLQNGRFMINEQTGGAPGGLPQGELFVYVFEGTDLPANLPTVPPSDILASPIGFSSE